MGDIRITPNRGNADDPNIEFIGNSGVSGSGIYLNVLEDGSLSFEGTAGQLFSITDSLTGTIFSVNDIAGIPSVEVDDDGTIRLAEFTGNVLIGTNTDDGSSRLQVSGKASISDDLNVSSGTLFVDVSTNRVGVGTSSPSYTLHSNGDTFIGGNLIIDSYGMPAWRHIVFESYNNNSRIEFDGSEYTFRKSFTLNSVRAGIEVSTINAEDNAQFQQELQAKCFIETVVALSGTTPTVDCDEGNVFTLTTSGNTTFTFSYAGVGLTTNDAYGFTLKVTAGGTHTLTWPASVDWAGGTPPAAPASGETDVYVFFTHDGGTNWYGFLAGDAMS